MLGLVTIPYAVNAIFWFLFYCFYPRGVERMKQQLAAETAPAAH